MVRRILGIADLLFKNIEKRDVSDFIPWIFAVLVYLPWLVVIPWVFIDYLIITPMHEFFHYAVARMLGIKILGVKWFHPYAHVCCEDSRKKQLEWVARGAGGIGTASMLVCSAYLCFLFLPHEWWRNLVIVYVALPASDQIGWAGHEILQSEKWRNGCRNIVCSHRVKANQGTV